MSASGNGKATEKDNKWVVCPGSFEIADILGWSPNEVGRSRKVCVDQNATIVAVGRRIARGVNRIVNRTDLGDRKWLIQASSRV